MSSSPVKSVSAIRAAALVGLLLAASTMTTRALAQSVPEDSVKAAFLYRFTDYVEWPAPALQSSQFTIAVLDDPEVAADLEHLVAGHQIKGRTAQVKLIHHAKEVADAQIVFMASGDEDVHRRFINNLSGQPVLIVTDESEGLEEGSTVNFRLVDHKLRFEISLTAAARSGLKISSELLSVAARVEGHLRSNIECAPQAAARSGQKSRCPVTVATQ
ncbi:MAG TPA: YfiR family protein [Steroidobacteraceae bacterium]